MSFPSRREHIAAPLADLKLPGALEALDGVLSGVDGGGTTASEAIERLLAAQIALRNSRRLGNKTFSDFDFSFQASIPREQIDSLHELGFVERQENIVFLGPPGVGKTSRAIRWAIAAAERGRRVYSGTSVDLIDSWEEAEAAGRLNPRLKTLTHPALLVGDEIGTLPVSPSGAVLWFQRVNRCYERASTVLTSNQGFEEWGQTLGEEVMAAALLDRVLPRCPIVHIRGHSDRLRRHAELSKTIHPTAARAVSAEDSGAGRRGHEGAKSGHGSPRGGRYAPLHEGSRDGCKCQWPLTLGISGGVRGWAGIPACLQRPESSRWPPVRFGASLGRRVHPAPQARCSGFPPGPGSCPGRRDTHRESRKSLKFWPYCFTPRRVTFA